MEGCLKLNVQGLTNLSLYARMILINTITRRQNETAPSNYQALVYITHGMNLFLIVHKNKHKYLYNIPLLGFRTISLLGCPTLSYFSLSLDHR